MIQIRYIGLACYEVKFYTLISHFIIMIHRQSTSTTYFHVQFYFNQSVSPVLGTFKCSKKFKQFYQPFTAHSQY